MLIQRNTTKKKTTTTKETKINTHKEENKGQHGTDPWPIPYCLDIFPTPQRLQNMLFIPYGGARPSAGLGHVCSRLFNESITQSMTP